MNIRTSLFSFALVAGAVAGSGSLHASRIEGGNKPGAKSAKTLNKKAAPVPMAIKVNIFGLTFLTESQPLWKNGKPPHTITGVASRN